MIDPVHLITQSGYFNTKYITKVEIIITGFDAA